MPAGLPRRAFILAVDDDPSIHDAFELIFSEEYEFLGVCDGHRALEVLRARPVDVVLLDLVMPGLGGLELLRQITTIRPRTKVIVVSVIDQVRPALASIRLGAVDYVTKPFEENHLRLLVRQAVGQTVGGRVKGGGLPDAAPCVLIVGESLGIRATLAAALNRYYMVTVVRSFTEAAHEFAQTRPDLILADVVGDASEAVFVRLQGRFRGVPLIWIASPSQWAPLVRDQSAHSPYAVFRTPVDYGRLLGEAVNFLWPQGAPLSGKPGRLSGRAITYVSEHFAATSVDDIARALRVSSGHLSRMFRDEMGISPKDFLDRVRFEAAKCLLRETREKIGAISLVVGLCDAPHLARLFRLYDRRTPREYRLSGPSD